MKNAVLLPTNSVERVKRAIVRALEIYISKFACGEYSANIEAPFQFDYGYILRDLLELSKLYSDERFVVSLEDNVPIDRRRDEVDIVITYTKGRIIEKHLIELKYKKASAGSPASSVIPCYEDMYDMHKHRTSNPSEIKSTWFIFLTPNKQFVEKPKESQTGLHTKMCLYDGYTIEAGKTYIADNADGLKRMAKYPNGFVFEEDKKIEYHSFKRGTVDYWYLIMEM